MDLSSSNSRLVNYLLTSDACIHVPVIFTYTRWCQKFSTHPILRSHVTTMIIYCLYVIVLWKWHAERTVRHPTPRLHGNSIGFVETNLSSRTHDLWFLKHTRRPDDVSIFRRLASAHPATVYNIRSKLPLGSNRAIKPCSAYGPLIGRLYRARC